MQYWEPLTATELEQLHQAACRVLAELGVRVRDAEAVEVLVKAGASRVDRETVRIPRDLVEWAVEAAPSSFALHDRRGGSLLVGGKDHLHLPGGTMTEVLDYPDWTRRPATLQDVAQFARLTDALDSMDITIPVVEGRDAPEGMGEILSCAEVLKNSTKFCLACSVEARAHEAFVEMAKSIAGSDDLSSKPFVGLLVTVVPGYEIDAEGARTMLLAAREGLPIVLMGGAIRGAQSPATMAGAMVMKAAGNLAALCIMQSARPGSPCLLDWGQIKLDMRTAEIEEAGPEYAIALAAGAQLSRRYNIPSYSCPSADSKIGDLQAGYEFAANMMTAMLSGIHVTVNAGTAAKCSAASYELLILHNEMLHSMKRVRRGLNVTEETLAVDLQLEVGLRGDYLFLPHTLRTIRDRDEFLHKDLFDATGIRASYQDPLARASERWRQLLKEHQSTVSTAERRAVDRVVEGIRWTGGHSRPPSTEGR